MKQWICLFAAASLLLVLGGCGGEAQPSEPAAQPLPQPSAQAAELRVSDLQDYLSDLDSSGGTLTFCGETEDTRPADAAIRASDYLKDCRATRGRLVRFRRSGMGRIVSAAHSPAAIPL